MIEVLCLQLNEGDIHLFLVVLKMRDVMSVCESIWIYAKYMYGESSID